MIAIIMEIMEMADPIDDTFGSEQNRQYAAYIPNLILYFCYVRSCSLLTIAVVGYILVWLWYMLLNYY